jgi:lipoprotein-releasing system permease protein
VKGLLLGNIIGIKLNPHDYYMSFVPIGWHWEILGLLNILTFFVVSLVLLLPTMVIAGINPIKAIRFD